MIGNILEVKSSLFKGLVTAMVLFVFSFFGSAQESTVEKNLIFYAPFNETATAQIAAGDTEIYSASSRKELENAEKGLKLSNAILAKGNCTSP